MNFFKIIIIIISISLYLIVLKKLIKIFLNIPVISSFLFIIKCLILKRLDYIEIITNDINNNPRIKLLFYTKITIILILYYKNYITLYNFFYLTLTTISINIIILLLKAEFNYIFSCNKISVVYAAIKLILLIGAVVFFIKLLLVVENYAIINFLFVAVRNVGLRNSIKTITHYPKKLFDVIFWGSMIVKRTAVNKFINKLIYNSDGYALIKKFKKDKYKNISIFNK